MNTTAKWCAALAIATSTWLGMPALAQEADGESERYRHFWIQLEAFPAQPAGTDDIVATRNDSQNEFATTPETLQYDTELKGRWRVGYNISDKAGSIVFTWYAQEQVVTQTELTPSQYIWGETNVLPLYAGTFYDGLADGYSSTGRAKLRDLRLDYYHNAFKTDHIDGKWFVGYRRVNHTRTHDTTYYSMIPNLPPLLDPISEPQAALVPRPDSALIDSDVNVRGVEAGLDVFIPLAKKRLWIESGLAVAAMRGRVSTTYRSQTHFTVIRPGDGSVEVIDLNDPNVYEDEARVSQMQQEEINVGIESSNESGSASIIEGYFGLRWRVWDALEIVGGFRSTVYQDFVQQLVFRDATPNSDLTRFTGTEIERVTKSVTYEGYYLGLSYMF